MATKKIAHVGDGRGVYVVVAIAVALEVIARASPAGLFTTARVVCAPCREWNLIACLVKGKAVGGGYTFATASGVPINDQQIC